MNLGKFFFLSLFVCDSRNVKAFIYLKNINKHYAMYSEQF